MTATTTHPFHVPLDAIEWDTVFDDGTRLTDLAGAREPGELVSYAFFIPAGVYDAPHSHPNDRHLVVAAEALRIGYGDRSSRDELQTVATGSFLFVPAGVVHFDGADVDTVLIGTAKGPGGSDYLNA